MTLEDKVHKFIKQALTVLIVFFSTFGLLSFCGGCRTTQCQKSTEQRCLRNSLQLCDSAGKWRTVISCDSLQYDKWKCKCQEGKCGCFQKDEEH